MEQLLTVPCQTRRRSKLVVVPLPGEKLRFALRHAVEERSPPFACPKLTSNPKWIAYSFRTNNADAKLASQEGNERQNCTSSVAASAPTQTWFLCPLHPAEKPKMTFSAFVMPTRSRHSPRVTDSNYFAPRLAELTRHLRRLVSKTTSRQLLSSCSRQKKTKHKHYHHQENHTSWTQHPVRTT